MLLVAIILVCGYIIAAPMFPQAVFYWRAHHGRQQQLTQLLHTQTITRLPSSAATSQMIPTAQPNHIIIPGMQLNQVIIEGPVSQTYQIIDKGGLWRWPLGSTPDQGGNTVLLGHRFSYTGPRGVLYFLDKVRPGDEIGIIWDNKTYTYKVSGIREVLPTDTSIEEQSARAELTIFTCTPLWLPKQRLVVVAYLETGP